MVVGSGCSVREGEKTLFEEEDDRKKGCSLNLFDGSGINNVLDLGW